MNLQFDYSGTRTYVHAIPPNAIYHKVNSNGEPFVNENGNRYHLSTFTGAICTYWMNTNGGVQTMDPNFQLPIYSIGTGARINPGQIWSDNNGIWYSERLL